jgi:hypothetical protein
MVVLYCGLSKLSTTNLKHEETNPFCTFLYQAILEQHEPLNLPVLSVSTSHLRIIKSKNEKRNTIEASISNPVSAWHETETLLWKSENMTRLRV